MATESAAAAAPIISLLFILGPPSWIGGAVGVRGLGAPFGISPAHALGAISFDERAQNIEGEAEAALDLVVGAFEQAVLVLDDDGPIIARPVEAREEIGPVHVAHPQSRGICQPMPTDIVPFS